MEDEFEKGPLITYHFFKAISTKDRSYLCDFYKVLFKDGILQYKVNLQSLNHKEVLVDMIYTTTNGWRLAQKHEDINADVEWKLITAILEQQET
jgi:hypothetical protein